MSGGGGEILRAVLEASCVSSRPAFYVMSLTANNGVAARATERGFFQCLKDRWFLMTSVIPTGTESLGFQRIDEDEYIRFYDPGSNQEYVLRPDIMPQSLYNESALAFSVTMPEYLLWSPASLIGVEWEGRNFNVDTERGFKFLTLAGIEYQMKG